jgi:valyl-tRNA synthetase
VGALRLALSVVLRLLAPVVPYITEEVWSWAFAEETGHASIHRAPWPTEAELAAVVTADDATLLPRAAAAMAAVNKRKGELGASVGRVVTSLTVAANAATAARLRPAWSDVAASVRAATAELVTQDDLADDVVAVLACEVAPPTAAEPAPE